MKTPLASIFTAVLTFALAGAAIAAEPGVSRVVRPAPDFALASGQSLKTFRGQPVVLLVAPTPESRDFRKQVKRLEEEYKGFAARGTIFIAAFTESSEGLHSNIPFAVARSGAAIAAAYGASAPFTLMVIGKDGNLDLITGKVSPASRVKDAIYNNSALQSDERRL